MLTLNVQVSKTRDRSAFAVLREGFHTVLTDQAAASATPIIAAQHANPACDPLRLSGHPPFGSYRFLHREAADPEQAKEYGSHILVFEPESGQALEAESFGRLALLVYGGPRGGDRRMRRTQGGVRLTDKMLFVIASRLDEGVLMKLDIVPLLAPAWWQFWKSAPETQPLSATQPPELPAPHDELSLLEALLARSPRPDRATGARDERFDRDSRSDRTTSDSSERSGAAPFEGKGGASGGAGASGSWDGPARSGVDSAGRIIGAAAAVGAIGALAAMAHGKEGEAGSGDSDGATGGDADTSTETSY